MTGVCDVKEDNQASSAKVLLTKVSKECTENGTPVNGEVPAKSEVLNGVSNGMHCNGPSDGGASDREVEIQSSALLVSTNGIEEGAGDSEGIVLIQDTGFTIQVHTPGAEPFELAVSTMELVQEIYQVLVDREDTCHRTCFSLQLNGVTLDNFAELKSFEGLSEGSIIKVVEELYTMREARIHLRHIRDLLKSVDLLDAYTGVDCASLSFLNTVTGGDILDRKLSMPDTIDCTPPEYIMPGSKERPLLPLHPIGKETKAPQCVKVLTYSGWNPPPGNRKMHGDLMYLFIVTIEEKRYHVTASTKGFYVNQSTSDEFNPRPVPQPHLSHSLIDLLNQISPIFKKNFALLLKKRAQKHPFERVATPYQVYSWMTPPTDHNIDYIRAEDAFSSRLGYEEQIPGQTRDWNEELQTTRELPRKNLPERLIRERAIFKVHSDFVVAATRGAIAVVDGNIMAINPGEETKMQMFLWNNIFFSLGFDVKDHYKDFGGDAAAYSAPGNDLQGVKAYAGVDTEGLYTLGTVVVDYRGFRVTAQSIIPGILEREQEQSVVYGSIDFGKTIVTSEQYIELLKKTASALKIRQHKVINDKEEEIELYSSVECKGITGNDGRHYVLDLLRTFPVDLNFFTDVDIELSKEVRDMGFPRAYPHKLVSLRQELVDTFTENRYITFVKNAAYQFQQIRLKKMQEEKEAKAKKESEKDADKAITEKDEKNEKNEKKDDLETDEAKKIVEACTNTNSDTFAENSKEVVRKAAQAVNSLSDTEFSIAFNTDLFQPHVKHAHEDSEAMKREKALMRDAAEFLLVHQIPNFLRDCLDHTSSPIDGYTLTEALHHNGINMRYLGKVTEMVARHPQLSYLHTICVSELVTRATKHLFKTFMQSVETMSLSGAVSHFLNCVLGSYVMPHAAVTDELQSQRSKKRNRKRNRSAVVDGADLEWAAESPRSLWKKIINEVKEYYHFKLDCDGIDSCMEKYSVQQVSLLRVMCKKLGIQLSLREYAMDSRTRQAFTEDDVINIHPVVKHIHPKATDAYHVFTTGQQKIQQGLLRDGYELISEALNLLNNVYGAMHPEIAACARLLARLNYIMGDYGEALAFQQRAVLMSERVLGIDHPNTITEYAHLALYCFANNQISTALRLMYHARYLALLCHGEDHPEVALFDSNIGLILHAVGEFDLSLKFLMKALDLNTKFFGEKSLKVAMSYHLVARAYSCKGDFRTALGHERDAFGIYKSLLGDEHERTKESSECLKHLTQQAVKFQKTMNEIYKGETSVQIPPLQIHTPSLANVLDTLNLINGIVFLHISQEDIDKFREEMLRRQEEPDKAEIEDGDKEASSSSNSDSATEQPTEKKDAKDTSDINETTQESLAEEVQR